MIFVLFDVDHYWPTGMDSDKRFRAYFKSIDDALMWASFYSGKTDEPDPEYSRSWLIRGIFQDNTCLNYSPDDYIHTDMSWDEIDALPVVVKSRYED